MKRASGDIRPRRGKLGLLHLLIALCILAPLFIVVVDAAFAPWIYLVGGRLRLLPIWAGSGEVMGPGGRYQVWAWFSPQPNGSRVLPGISVLGTGTICTPRGESFKLKVTGLAHGRIWRNMDGHDFYLWAYRWPIVSPVNHETLRPNLAFRGHWSGPNLAMTDDGTIANAFRADGSLNTKSRTRYDKMGATPITFVETGRWWWPPACPKGENF